MRKLLNALFKMDDRTRRQMVSMMTNIAKRYKVVKKRRIMRKLGHLLDNSKVKTWKSANNLLDNLIK